LDLRRVEQDDHEHPGRKIEVDSCCDANPSLLLLATQQATKVNGAYISSLHFKQFKRIPRKMGRVGRVPKMTLYVKMSNAYGSRTFAHESFLFCNAAGLGAGLEEG
jgi:hypothetical protein